MADKDLVAITAATSIAGIDLLYAVIGGNSRKITVANFFTSPTLVTPALGVATATSVAIGGATIGTNALAVTGTTTLNESVGSSALTIVGATQTASKPALNITQTWNNSGVIFEAVVVNVTATASDNASRLLSLKTSGVERLGVGPAGELSQLLVGKTGVQFSIQVAAGANAPLKLARDSAVGWTSSSGDATGTLDTTISRNAAGATQFGTTAANAAGSWLATSAGLGPTPVLSASTMLNISAGTTAISQMRFGASTAPTSPVDGDFWFDGTNVKIRVSGATKTFTLT